MAGNHSPRSNSNGEKEEEEHQEVAEEEEDPLLITCSSNSKITTNHSSKVWQETPCPGHKNAHHPRQEKRENTFNSTLNQQ
jgi:hypothetical protein